MQNGKLADALGDVDPTTRWGKLVWLRQDLRVQLREVEDEMARAVLEMQQRGGPGYPPQSYRDIAELLHLTGRSSAQWWADRARGVRNVPTGRRPGPRPKPPKRS